MEGGVMDRKRNRILAALGLFIVLMLVWAFGSIPLKQAIGVSNDLWFMVSVFMGSAFYVGCYGFYLHLDTLANARLRQRELDEQKAQFDTELAEQKARFDRELDEQRDRHRRERWELK
jgi:hypothetical protein